MAAEAYVLNHSHPFQQPTTVLDDFINISLVEENDLNLERDPLSIVLPMTVIYVLIFITGLIGNVSTCIVIYRNKSMHTATNYYLFSLAISDLLLLISGLPPEIYHMWSPWVYIFGESFCFIQGFAAETSANASVLTITAFTVERYVAICHPFLSHTMSKLSRAIKFVLGIWIVAVCLALPQAIQFGVKYEKFDEYGLVLQSRCTMTWMLLEHIFEISTFLIFIGPMSVITALYLLIGVKLRKSRLLSDTHKSTDSAAQRSMRSSVQRRNTNAQNHVIRMLIAVVVAFFICWAPFHAQRLLAVYAASVSQENHQPNPILISVYTTLNYISGVLYFMSTTINPLLYNIMSNKFREAFKNTMKQLCKRQKTNRQPTYSSLLRYTPSLYRSRNEFKHFCKKGINPTRANDIIPSVNGETNHSQSGANGHASSQASNGDEILMLHTTNPSFPLGTQISLSRRRISDDCSSQLTAITSIHDKHFTAPEPLKLNCSEPRTSHAHARTFSHGKLTKLASSPNACARSIKSARFNMVKLVSFKLGCVFASDSECQNTGNFDSAQTISNSSLQDLDEMEHSSSDLVQIMAEVNQTIVAS